MLISLSTDQKKLFSFPRLWVQAGFNSSILAAVKPFSAKMFCPVDDPILLRQLNKLGMYTVKDVNDATNATLKTLKTKNEKLEFSGGPLLTAVTQAFRKHYTIKLTGIKQDDNKLSIDGDKLRDEWYGEYLRHGVAVYNFIALKLCSLLRLKADKASGIAYFLITGSQPKGLGLPRAPQQVLDLFSDEAEEEVKTKKQIVLKLTDVTRKMIEKHGSELVSQLPALFTEYVDQFPKNTILNSLTGKQEADRRKDRRIASEKLLEEVGKEMYTFFALTIPQCSKYALYTAKEIEPLNAIGAKLRSSLMEAHKQLRELGGSVDWKGNVKISTKEAVKYKVEIERLNKELHDLHKKIQDYSQLTSAAPWMAPYVSSKFDIKMESGRTSSVKMDDGILIHRLVQRANTRKLKAGALELGAVLDSGNAAVLTAVGIDCILDCLGWDTPQAFATVFRDVAAYMKPRVFGLALFDKFGGGLDTELGKVTDKRLLRLNDFTIEDERVLATQYAAEIKKWNYKKTKVEDAVKTIVNSKKTASSAYKVVPASPEQLRKFRAEMKDRIWGGHGVVCSIDKAWVLKESATIHAILRNNRDSTLRVVPDVYHGTSKQAGSIILHCGFKVEGTQVTGRAMGDVLYVAPNLDKSSQYMGKAGFTRNAKGIVFVGDVVVSGHHAQRLDGAAGSTFAWTKTERFKTEEIGVANPNKQFVIRRAYLVTVKPDPVTAWVHNPHLAQFKQPMTVEQYLAHYKNG